MFPCIVEYNGSIFQSSEAAYMSRKNNSKAWLDLCVNTKDGRVIKKASHYIYIIKKWPDIKLVVMEEVLRIKFAIPELKDLLLSTGDLPIFEGNTWGDYFWGCHFETLEGENNLGKLLMKIRSDLRN